MTHRWLSARRTSRRAQIIVTVPAILELPISVEDEDKTKERTSESEVEGGDDDLKIDFLKSQMVTTQTHLSNLISNTMKSRLKQSPRFKNYWKQISKTV